MMENKYSVVCEGDSTYYKFKDINMDRHRVCYYSQSDLSVGWNLQEIEELMTNFDLSKFVKDINDVLELYHIKKYIDHDNCLLKWEKGYIDSLKSMVRSFPGIIVRYLRTIPKEELYDYYKLIDWSYTESFWEVVANYDLLDLLDESFLDKVLTEDGNLRLILQQERIVNKFAKYLKSKIMSNSLSAHILLDQYARSNLNDNGRTYFFPSSLTSADKEQIIVDFLNQGEPNLNYVRLVMQVRDNANEIILTPKTRLLAQDVERHLNEKFFGKANVTHFACGVECDRSDNIPPTRIGKRENGFIQVHSWKYIEGMNETEKILVFGNLFGLLGEDCLINLVNKDSETGGLESFLMDCGKDAYFMNQSCRLKNFFALANTNLYSRVLPAMECRLESLVKNFYENHFKEDYGYPALQLALPAEDADWVAKCRTIIPELDSVSKQYNLFVEEGDIDPRLFSLGKPLLPTDAKSLFENKYYVIKRNSLEILEPMMLLFRTAEVLHVVDGFDTTRIHNFYDFITSCEVPYSVYKKDYHKNKINKLIAEGYVRIDEQGVLKPNNQSAIEILGCLWRNRVVSYWHHSKPVRELLDKWKEDDLLEIDDHLLCESERNLFSYYLNNNKYTNGPAIRNQYAHGVIPVGDDVQVHAKNYFILLMLLILLLLKIEDEFRIGFRILDNLGEKL